MKVFITALTIMAACVFTGCVNTNEYHVSTSAGLDGNPGTRLKPFKTISAAASIAQPGDTVTVHEGVYRERINPPRGGESEKKRITYQSAKGDKVVIKGSEIVKGWRKVQNDTWKVTLDNSFFGDLNPYSDLIRGDWFNPKGRQHHTGAVYLDDHWMIEASKIEDVMQPVGKAVSSYISGYSQYLVNVAWLEVVDDSKKGARISAVNFASNHGIQTAACDEGGQCIGWIERGDWVSYEKVDFGRNSKEIEIRTSSGEHGGIIEVRLDGPDGELIGSCKVPNTGGWQKWASLKPEIKPTSGVKTVCLVFRGSEPKKQAGVQLWFAKVDSANTTIWAQFKDVNPNESQVEINVRQSVFYPEKPGMNYITVRGFTMMHAATNWAPPTAEQIGLVGTHWSKGWIIEHNDISYSTCVGVTLGKHGDEFDNTSANTAGGYVKTIERGLSNGWSKENIGHHVVRNNHISYCEQAGIVGSLGPVFCTVTNNTIHDIHVRRLFTGAEMAGIKFHGAVDTLISNNHIYRTNRGIWLDWMSQGTRVTGNLLHDNGPGEDVFVEVNHGPFVVDNNFLLSRLSLWVNSQGCAYVHNLITGRVRVLTGERRQTPYLKEHSTEIAGLADNLSGDERYYNNLIVNIGLSEYDPTKLPMFTGGNVYLSGAKPHSRERSALIAEDFEPGIKLQEKSDCWQLEMAVDPTWASKQKRDIVTTGTLGKAKVPDLPYVKPNGTDYRFDTDYFGKKRNTDNPAPGPFEFSNKKVIHMKVWPKK